MIFTYSSFYRFWNLQILPVISDKERYPYVSADSACPLIWSQGMKKYGENAGSCTMSYHWWLLLLCFNLTFRYLPLSWVCKHLGPLCYLTKTWQSPVCLTCQHHTYFFLFCLWAVRDQRPHTITQPRLGTINTLAGNDGMAFHRKHLKIFSETSYFSPVLRKF